MPETTGAKSAWLKRVLGIDIDAPAHPTAPLPTGGPVLPLWVEAKDTVDAGIAKLQQNLRSSERPGLRIIAEYGLNGLSTRETTGMMVALRNLDAAPESEKARGKAAAAAAAFRAFLDSNEVLPLLEKNPFGVAVPVRATYARALDAIEARLG